MHKIHELYTNMREKLRFNSRKERVDFIIHSMFLLATVVSASFIIIIVIFIAQEGMIPFVTDNDGLGAVNLWRFLTGFTWLKGTAFQSNLYAVGYIIINTLYVAFLSLLLAMPIGVLTALFIAKIAPKKLLKYFGQLLKCSQPFPQLFMDCLVRD